MESNPVDEQGSSRGSAVLSLLLAAVSFVFPVSVYYIGNGMGAGVAFPLIRYQQTSMGASLISLWRDIDLVTSGAITGRSALVPFFWLFGVLLCLAGLVFAYRYYRLHAEQSRKYSGVCLMVAGVAYLGGIIAQYGFSFAGPAGFAVPVGAAFLFVAGWFVASGFPGLISEKDDDEDDSEIIAGNESSVDATGNE